MQEPAEPSRSTCSTGPSRGSEDTCGNTFAAPRNSTGLLSTADPRRALRSGTLPDHPRMRLAILAFAAGVWLAQQQPALPGWSAVLALAASFGCAAVARHFACADRFRSARARRPSSSPAPGSALPGRAAAAKLRARRPPGAGVRRARRDAHRRRREPAATIRARRPVRVRRRGRGHRGAGTGRVPCTGADPPLLVQRSHAGGVPGGAADPPGRALASHRAAPAPARQRQSARLRLRGVAARARHRRDRLRAPARRARAAGGDDVPARLHRSNACASASAPSFGTRCPSTATPAC